MTREHACGLQDLACILEIASMRSAQRLFAGGLEQDHLVVDFPSVEIELDFKPCIVGVSATSFLENLEGHNRAFWPVVLDEEDHSRSDLMRSSEEIASTIFDRRVKHIREPLGKLRPQVLECASDLNLDELSRETSDGMNRSIPVPRVLPAVNNRRPREQCRQRRDDAVLPRVVMIRQTPIGRALIGDQKS